MRPETPECSAAPLRELLAQHHPDHCMAFADLFAIACLLHLQGQQLAARKAIAQVLDAVPSRGQKTYLSSILSQLEGNEIRFAQEIFAHEEINDMIRKAQPPEPEKIANVPAPSFGAWLKKQADRDDVIGDLSKDVARDPNAPRGGVTKEKWQEHIQQVGWNTAGALAALDDAWAEFSNWSGK